MLALPRGAGWQANVREQSWPTAALRLLEEREGIVSDDAAAMPVSAVDRRSLLLELGVIGTLETTERSAIRVEHCEDSEL